MTYEFDISKIIAIIYYIYTSSLYQYMKYTFT